MNSNDDVSEVGNLVGELAALDVDGARREAIREAGHQVLASSQSTWMAGLGDLWRRSEVALAFGVAALYMTLAFHAVISIY